MTLRLALSTLLPLLLLAQATPASEPPPPPPQQTPRLRELDFAPFTTALQSLSQERITTLYALLLEATIPDLQLALTAGKVTSEELTLFFLHQIQLQDETLRSYIELNPRCLEQARAADHLRRTTGTQSPLHGIPINLKDNIATAAPLHTTVGTERLLHHSPKQDAALVKQLREAGAIILGKTSLSELAGMLTSKPPGSNAITGRGINPYHPSLPVSGSSSGSAISTTAYLTTASIGTETSGSLISPAASNGLVALKPTPGLVSGDGIVPLIRFQDTAGPIARQVTDAALLLSVIDSTEIDYASHLKPDALADVPVGILRSSLIASEPTASTSYWLDLIDQGLRQAKAIPHDLDETFATKPSLFPVLSLGLSVDTLGYFRAAGAPIQTLAELQAYNLAQPETRIPRGQNIVDLAVQVMTSLTTESGLAEPALAPLYEQAALDLRQTSAALLAQTFADHQVALLISLSNTHSTLYATAGYPAITIPLGLDSNGTPNGVTFIGKPGQDAQLLGYAYAFEQATRLRSPPPPPKL